MRTHKYWLHFRVKVDGVESFGQCEAVRPIPITGAADLNEMQGALIQAYTRDHKLPDGLKIELQIIGFTKFEELIAMPIGGRIQ